LREKFSASTFLDDARKHRTTSSTAPVGLLLATPPREDDADNPVRVMFAGHNTRLAQQLTTRFGIAPLDAYGSTEAGFPLVRRSPDESASMGWLRPGYSVRVVDGDGNDVEPGEVGELLVRPPARELMMREYLGRPDATAAAWDGEYYRTGDAVVANADGSFTFQDRMRDTIRRLGENISSQQVEDVVAADPEVGACAVLGVPDRIAGQEVMLVVQPREPDAVTDPAALFGRLTATLPKYMLPAYIAVVDELPLTPTHKVQKTGLLDTIDISTAWRSPQLRGR
jgi:crotonobetaine/carnitine-CoA ligase